MPAPTTAIAGLRPAIGLSGFRALLEPLQRELNMFIVGGGPVGDPGGAARDFAEPSRPPIPGALGDLAAAVGGNDVVLPAGYRKDGVLDIEREDAARLRIGDGA